MCTEPIPWVGIQHSLEEVKCQLTGGVEVLNVIKVNQTISIELDDLFLVFPFEQFVASE